MLQPGVKQVAAGYVVYGSSTILVYSAGNGVHGFTLDPAIGAFMLSHENIRMPAAGKILFGERSQPRFVSPRAIGTISAASRWRVWVANMARATSARWWPTCIARCSKEASFFIRRRRDHPAGKLRLLYEANPIAFLIEQAGGMATDGERRILDIQPESIHQRTPLAVGSRVEIEALRQCLRESG